MLKRKSKALLNKLKNSQDLAYATKVVKDSSKRLVDQHVNLAVTGLSRSGKTAFISSLVNQLLHANGQADLSFLNARINGNIIGVKRIPQPNPTLKHFAYDEAVSGLSESKPVWPKSTNGVSQIRLSIKYRPHSTFRRILQEESTLLLDITDYPGEWLLDLPLLEMDFVSWCEVFNEDLQNLHRAKLCEPFLQQLEGIDVHAKADEAVLKSLADSYHTYLKVCKIEGFQHIQPGRFVLPGELEHAPVLHFFPLPNHLLNQLKNTTAIEEGSYAQRLNAIFEQYKQHVVKPFYQQHFKRFDRQVVLVDCLSALNLGQHAFDELETSVHWLLKNFKYGKSDFLSRLFSPKIDKLVFAATKADHITPEQHENLAKLLDSIIYSARQKINYDGIATESTAFSAICSSKVGQAKHEGSIVPALSGTTQDGDEVFLFPGQVPTEKPASNLWSSHQFQFPDFAPPQVPIHKPIPHIRMDQIIDFVLGDKLQ